MAEKLGITRSYYGEIESGKREPGATLEILVDVMGALLSRREEREAAVEEGASRYSAPVRGGDVVAPNRGHPPPPDNPTRADCSARLDALLDLAGKIPGGLALVYSDLSVSLAELRRRLAAHEESELP